MAAGEEIRIVITGTQFAPGTMAEGAGGIPEPVITEQEVQACFYKKGEAYYLLYEEQPEGYPDVLKTRVKYKGSMLEVDRKGPMANSMTFEMNKVYRTEYKTPFGVLMLDVATKSLDAENSGAEDWPDIRVCYHLKNEDEILGEYELSIKRKH